MRDTAALYSIYWKIVSQGNVTYVDDNSDDKRYVVLKPSQHCHGNNFTCCRFVSYLQVDTSVISASDKTVMTCNAIFREDNSVSSPSSLSEFICYLNMLLIVICVYTVCSQSAIWYTCLREFV